MTPRDEMTDQELLRAYAEASDAESLGAFVLRHQDSLVRFVSGFLQDRVAAQDIVQETFLRVARSPGKLAGVESPHNWLLRVARNLSVDHVRRTLRGRRKMREYAERRAWQTAAAEPDDREVERDEARERVRAEIQRLAPRLKELMLLKVQEGKTYREIAEITGLTITNVGYLLHQAMRTMARRLNGLEERL
ncbi:MAG: RNA polymerase sigma factor [Planctomycetes bacterium]|nr:RNA polymerase sigma factor [Planctomycetota bacterium]